MCFPQLQGDVRPYRLSSNKDIKLPYLYSGLYYTDSTNMGGSLLLPIDQRMEQGVLSVKIWHGACWHKA